MNIQINSGVGSIAANPLQPQPGGGQALSDAFRAELASVLESTLEKYGINPGALTISVNPASSNSQPRQNSVAPNPVTTAAPAPAASSPAPAPAVETLTF